MGKAIFTQPQKVVSTTSKRVEELDNENIEQTAGVRYNPATDRIEVWANGMWNEWDLVGLTFDGYLYNAGRVNTDYWGTGYALKSKNANASVGMSFGDVHIAAGMSSAGEDPSYALWCLTTPFEADNYSKLTVHFSSVGCGYYPSTVAIAVASSPNVTAYSALTTKAETTVQAHVSTPDVTITVDISALTGEQYIYLYVQTKWDGNTYPNIDSIKVTQ